jgi:hypothetical protein
MSNPTQKVLPNPNLPPPTMSPIPGGSVGKAVIITQNQQANAQNSLAQTGGIRRNSKMNKHRSMKGGEAAVIAVAGAPSFAPDPAAVNANNKSIAMLAAGSGENAKYDALPNQASVARMAAGNSQNSSVKTGGSRRKRRAALKSKKGGSWPAWGCLSGGKKSRRHKKNCMCKRRKTRKHMKRQRR